MKHNLSDVKEVFDHALEIESPQERQQWLDQACIGRPGLRLQVDELLKSYDEADSFLDSPPPGLTGLESKHDSHKAVAGTNQHISETSPHGVLGDFRIIREVGRGGMGVVYEAEQISLKRRVALKVLPFAAVMDPRQLKRFETEALAAAGLHHGNIVPVHQFSSERAVHFYAMQYIEGQDVAELIGQLRQLAEVGGGNLPETQLPDFELASSIASGQFAPPEPTRRLVPLVLADDSQSSEQSVTPKSKSAVETRPLAELSTKGSTSKPEYFRTIAHLGIQAAEALQFAHENGILHRDIKPSNLMLDAKGKLWITDFGLARVEGDAGLTMTGDVMGTLRYMSPEQALGQRDVVDARSDVYSLGVTLYEMLTLTPIYPAVDRNELLQKRSQEEPTPLRQVNKEVPVDLETIVLKAIAKEPEDRYATAQEFADDLRRYLNHEPIRAKRPSVVNRLSKWVRRHKSLAAALLILAICGPLAGHSLFTLLSAEQAGNPAANSKLPVSPAPGKYLPGLVPEPTALSKIGRWQIITKEPRGVLKSGVWSPDEKLIAVGEAGNVRIYDASNLRLLQVLVGHKQHVTSIDWHPDGQRLASASWDGTVRMWTADGAPTHELKGHTGPVYQVQWRPDGQQIASCGADGTVRLWNAEGSIEKVLDEHRNHVFCLDWSPDGELLASGGGEIGTPDADGNAGDTAIRVWDVASGDLRAKFEGHNFSVLALDWHPDGQQLAAGDGDSFRMGQGVDVSPERHGVRIWNLDGSAGPVLDGEYGSIYAVAWTPDGTQLAFGGRRGVVHHWDSAKQVAASLTPEDGGASRFDLYSIVWKSDGSQLMTTERAALRIYGADGEPGLVLDRLPARNFASVAWSPDGKQLSSAGQIWQADGTPVKQSEADDSWTKFVQRFTDRHPVDGRIAQAVRDQVTVQSSSGEILWNYTAEGDSKVYFRAAKWSPDGKRLATACVNEHVVYIWSEEGKLLTTLKGHRGGVESVAWSPDGQWLASGGGATVRLWTPDGTAGPVIKGHTDEVYDVAWSPDGKWIASAGTDAMIRIWTPEGSPVKTLQGHHGGLHAIAWSPDSKKIASASWLDSTLRVWDVESGKTEWQLLRLTGNDVITLSPSGMVLHGDYRLAGRSILYLVEKPDGSMERLTYQDFHQDFAEQLISFYGQRTKSFIEQKEFVDSIVSYSDLTSFRNDDDSRINHKLAEVLHNNIGLAFYGQNKYEEAVRSFTIAAEIGKHLTKESPENKVYRELLETILFDRSGCYLTINKLDSAIADTTAVIDLNSSSHRAYAQRGYAFYLQNNHKKCLDDYMKAIELDPGNAAYLVNRGLTYNKLGQHQKALTDLNQAIDIDPNNANYYNQRGQSYLSLNQYQEALADFNTGLQMNPQAAGTLYNRAQVFTKTEQYGKALDDLTELINLRPKLATAYNHRGFVNNKLKQYDQAIADVSKAVELEPNNFKHLLLRGNILAVNNHLEEALKDYAKVRQTNSDPRSYWYYYSLVLITKGDVEGYRSLAAAMLERFRETVDVNQSYWTAWTCILGPQAVDDVQIPLKLAQQSLAFDPESTAYRQAVGSALYRAGLYDQALTQLSDLAEYWDQHGVTATDTSPVYTYFFLAMTHHRLGNFAESRNWLEKGIDWAKSEEVSKQWNRRVTLNLFQKEAETLLKPSNTTPDIKDTEPNSGG